MEYAEKKPKVHVIPATVRSVENGGQIKKEQKLRVAAYCRVSTGDESQQTSYTTQKAFYTQMITNRQGWVLAGIYADEAISGTSRTKRKQFNEMIQDAIHGQMDYIVTKSISRFARNTIDTLECVRQLRQLNPPVGIYFEKENIDTLDATGELILTILSALAQDESRSISDNIRWAIQRKFQNGEAMVDLKRMLGYDKDIDGKWLINQEQAEIVKYIYDRFVCGISANSIARELNKMGKKTVKGNIWRADSVLYILRNEKYVGDCENQKYITKNFLTHEVTVNHGEAVKYYVKNHHEAIIERVTWEKVQSMLQKNKKSLNHHTSTIKKSRGAGAAVFSNLICGEKQDGKLCGGKLTRLGYNTVLKNYKDDRSLSAEKIDSSLYKERYYFYYPVWKCINSTKGRQKMNHTCKSHAIYECALEQSFMEMLYFLKNDLDSNGKQSWIMKQFYNECVKLEQQNNNVPYSIHHLEMIEMQIQELEGKMNRLIETQWHYGENNSHDITYEGQLNQIKNQIQELKKERNIIEIKQDAAFAIRRNFDYFIRCLEKLPQENLAGMAINVNGLNTKNDFCTNMRYKKTENGKIVEDIPIDKEAMIQKAPDYLTFEKGIYMAFIKRGEIIGDVVTYRTNFGISLITTGNSRKLEDFLGYRRANQNKTITYIDEKWKISGKDVCYTRKKIK